MVVLCCGFWPKLLWPGSLLRCSHGRPPARVVSFSSGPVPAFLDSLLHRNQAMSPAPSSHHSQINSRKQKRMRKVDYTLAPHNDGHLWRKYGEKKINNTNFPRFYYRCTYKDDMNCPATKQVQRKDHSDPPLYAVTYYNDHSCDSAFFPLSPSQFQLQTSSGKKAVSICFDSSSSVAAAAPQEPPPAEATNATPSSSAAAAAAAARRGTPPEISNPPVLRRSETYPRGAVEQKPASCSTECHDAFSGAAGADLEEVVDAGRFGSIRFFHFL